MDCKHTLQRLNDLLDQHERERDNAGAGPLPTVSLDQPTLEHLAHCDDCQQRLDRLTDDVELRAAARRGVGAPQQAPTALRRAMQACDSLLSEQNEFDTLADDKQPDLARLLDPPQEPRDLGTIGRYQAQTILGSGGMSVVFAAWDPTLQRRVAIKVFTTSDDAQACKRFVREARAAAKIEHRAIVPVYEVVERDGKPPALVMPLMTGGTLQQQLGRDDLTPQRSAEIAARVADGLAEVHRRGQVHRDIKPGNILFDHDGQPRLGDFGLVRKHADEPLTEANVLPGTPEFIAPEQLLDNAPASVASDVYQLGLTLYTMLVGVCPYQGTVTTVLRRIVEGPPPRPSKQGVTIPADLETICLQAIERQPDNRYRSADALAEDLRRYLRGEPIAASRPTALATAYRWCKRRPAAAVLVGVALPCALALVFAYGGYQYQSRQRQRIEQQAQQQEKRADEAEIRVAVAEKKSEHAFGQIFSGVIAARRVQEPGWLSAQNMFLSGVARSFEQQLELLQLDPKRKNEIASIALGAADFRMRLNEHEQALKMYSIAIEQLDRQLSEEPTDTLWQLLTAALRGFGSALNQISQPELAIERLDRACAIAARQAHQQPKSLTWKLEGALAEAEFGHALAALGYQRDAVKQFDSGSQRVNEILRADAANFDWSSYRIQLADGISRLALGYQRLAKFDQAIELLQLAIEQNRQVGAGELTLARVADNHAAMSEILAEAGRTGEARTSLEAAIKSLNQAISTAGQPQRYQAQLLKWQAELDSAASSSDAAGQQI